jgi:hypothetical protein
MIILMGRKFLLVFFISKRVPKSVISHISEFLKFVGPNGAGPTEASFLAVLLSAKHFCFVLFVMALPNMSRGY